MKLYYVAYFEKGKVMLKFLKNRFVCGVFFPVVFLVAFLLWGVLYPVNKEEKIFEISKGDVLPVVIDRLKDENIIPNKFLFKLWMYLSWSQNNLKIGEYKIPAGASLNDVKNAITSGRMYNRFVTIPEGLTVKQIEEVLNSIEDLSGKITVHAKDGELLPQTYAYNKTVTKDDVIRKMQSAMVDLLDEEWEMREENLPIKTKEEAVILASIVERETGVAEERPLVASVFINRLNKGMRLQSDTTVVYTLTKGYGNMHGRQLFKKDLEVVTPYNTYKIKGLPAGAIANPGVESIRAVLHPAKTEYLYFVADGTGGHKFAQILEEHEKNRSDWRKIRDGK